MKKSLCVLSFLVTATLVAARPAQASLMTFEGVLLGLNEVPPVISPGIGTITVVLDDVADTLDVLETFSDLVAPTSAAHIHCCAPAGTNAAVRLPFTAGEGFPVGVTSGTFHHQFDLHTDLTGISVADFIAGLEGGQAYANIHTTQNPGGEIRGQLLPAVPEPGSIALLGTGLLMLGRRVARTRSGQLASRPTR